MEDLLAEPDPMLFDSARLVEQSSGAWEFEDIESGDLAAHLGLQNGDEPISIEGYSLQMGNGMNVSMSIASRMIRSAERVYVPLSCARSKFSTLVPTNLLPTVDS